MKESNTLRIYA